MDRISQYVAHQEDSASSTSDDLLLDGENWNYPIRNPETHHVILSTNHRRENDQSSTNFDLALSTNAKGIIPNNNGANGFLSRSEHSGAINAGGTYFKIGSVKVNIGTDDSSSEFGSPTQHGGAFPKEPEKLVIAFILLFISGLSNDLVLAFIHEKVPETPPLPDLFFRNTPTFPWALAASEYIIMVSGFCMILVCFLHKYRWVLFRRVFVISALLYLGRSVCMLVTQLPVADPTYYCSPKMNHTSYLVIFRRAFRLISGLGMKINGKHTLCGDYIYSGHTLVLVMAYLTVQEYSPRRWWLFHWAICLLSFSGVIMLLISRGHYTVDVIIAYWITTRTFWLYHTLSTSQSLRVNEYSHTNLISRVYWFPLFRYMEANVHSAVPRRFEWPFYSPMGLFSTVKRRLKTLD